MHLALVSPLPLGELRQQVINRFSHVRSFPVANQPIPAELTSAMQRGPHALHQTRQRDQTAFFELGSSCSIRPRHRQKSARPYRIYIESGRGKTASSNCLKKNNLLKGSMLNAIALVKIPCCSPSTSH